VTDNHTPEVALRIRITATPDPNLFDEFDVRRFRVGEVYEIPIRQASLLILSGFAETTSGTAVAEAADSAVRPPKPKSK